MYAGFWKRFFALLFDKIIISISVIILSIPLKLQLNKVLVYSGMNPYSLYKDQVQINYLYAFVFIILIPLFYYSILESSAKRATLSKIVVGIVV